MHPSSFFIAILFKPNDTAGRWLQWLMAALFWMITAAEAAVPVQFRSVADVRACQSWEPLEKHPLVIDGVVTLVDPARNLVVVQDKTGALALELGETRMDFQVGRHVVLEATDSWPFVNNLARYPDRPDKREILPRLDWAQEGEGGFFVSRLRARLLPPASGLYHFSIASDDSSRLLVGTEAWPRSRRQVAGVTSYTRPHDWRRTPRQRSEAIYLESGHAYYLEVVHHQAGGPSHLAVAWEGPGIDLSVIEGRYLSPWTQAEENGSTGGADLHGGGILRETWNDVPLLTPDEMLETRRLESVLSVRGIEARVVEPGVLPEPLQLKIGQTLPANLNFTWSEIEGTVTFVGGLGNRVSLELSNEGQSIEVIANHWSQVIPSGLRGRRVRVIGVAETVWSSDNPRGVGRLWLRPSDGVVVTEHAPQADVARLTKVSELLQGDPELLRETAVKLKGRVASQQGNVLTISDDGVFYGSVSEDGSRWTSIGTPLENEMPARVYVGFAVNSRQSTAKARAVFSHSEGLSGNLQKLDIGSPSCSGSLQAADGKFVVDGVGVDMWDSPDQFTFVYEAIEGPCSLVSRLDSFEPGDPNAKAGLMIRERLDADGQFIDLVSTSDRSLPVSSLQWRWARQGSSTRQVNDYARRNGGPLWLKLERRFSSIPIVSNDSVQFEPGELVNVTGYASLKEGRPAVVGASIVRSPRELEHNQTQRNWRPLVDLAQVNDGSGQWGGFDIFRLRGIVTFCGDVLGRHYWTFQDRSGAALLTPRDSSGVFSAQPGSMVEVFGDPGWHTASQTLYADNVFVLGPAAMPAPIRHPAEYLLPRRGEGTWIELEGIVRSVSPSGTLQVKSRGELFSVALADSQGIPLASLVDAEVRLRGAIVYPSEAERLLLVPACSPLDVLVPAPKVPFAEPLVELRSVTAESLLSQSRHRVRVSGVVTYAEQGLVYLQDESGGGRLELETPGPVEVGRTVVASGFPDWGADDCLVLRNASIRQLEPGRSVTAVDMSVEEAAAGSHYLQLVRVRAKLASAWSAGAGEALELEANQQRFRVAFPPNHTPAVTLPAGSVVELTGVNTREQAKGPATFSQGASSPSLSLRLLPRGASDLVVVQKPSMWVLRRTLIVASLVTLAAIVSLIWIQLLRRRVRQRTEELSATMKKLQKEASMSATLAERDRLAGEIHDSLEQGLNGIIFQLESTSNLDTCSKEVREALRLACNMATFSRTEVQYAVWELQSPMLEDSDLQTAVEKMSRQIAPESLGSTVRVEGTPRRLSSAIEHHLLRVVQEALNNIVKHAKATHVDVLLRYGADEVELRISDDGCGFDPGKVRTGGLGHFGLRSLRSRVSKIHGVLEVTSAAGKGTVVSVKVPLSNS